LNLCPTCSSLCSLCLCGSIRDGDCHRTGFTTETQSTQRRLQFIDGRKETQRARLRLNSFFAFLCDLLLNRHHPCFSLCPLCLRGSIRDGDCHRLGFTTEARRTQREGPTASKSHGADRNSHSNPNPDLFTVSRSQESRLRLVRSLPSLLHRRTDAPATDAPTHRPSPHLPSPICELRPLISAPYPFPLPPVPLTALPFPLPSLLPAPCSLLPASPSLPALRRA